MHFLLNTALGDRVCFLIERLTGCALVPLSDLGYRIVATNEGRALAKRGATTGSRSTEAAKAHNAD